MTRVTDMRIKIVHYHADGQKCTGSNLLYKMDGVSCSSRVPWVANNANEEIARVEKLLLDHLNNHRYD